VGAVLEALNFRALNHATHALFLGEVPGGSAWVAVLGMRFGALCVGMLLALQAGADPLALVLGLSIVMPAAVISAIRNRPPVIDHEPMPAIPPDDPSWDRWSIWRAGEIPAPVEADGELGEEDLG